jgi:signal transduction histidine kinase
MNSYKDDTTIKFTETEDKTERRYLNDSNSIPQEIFADLEETLSKVASSNPRVADKSDGKESRHADDLKAILEASLAINSSLVLEDMLQIVMSKAIELMQAERGLVMLLDESNKLQIKAVFNLDKDKMSDDDHKISSSIATQVANNGTSVYTSDALADKRFANKQSVVELHLRSIMCVPLKAKDKTVGVIYLDNSSQSKMFLKSDLYLFELYGQMVAAALHNARIYNSLYEAERYNDSVISTSPVGIIVVDAKGKIATINSTSLEIFELNKKEIKTIDDSSEPTNFIELLPEKEKPQWEYMINSVMADQEDFSNDRYYHNTGYVEKILSIKMTPLSRITSGSGGLVITVEDITDNVLMEKYVILSEKLVAKGEMASSIAHELNNYLAIASNNAELLQINIDRGQTDKVKFNSKSIVENIFKIKRFVDSLMDFSKPETEFITYDIKHLIEDLLFSLRIQPRFKRTHFTIDLGHNIPKLEMDVGLIQQVLLNLLNNAADAMEGKSINAEKDGIKFNREINIVSSYETESDLVKIEISDNGSGMSDDVLKKIFTKHFTTKKTGHGLGLANCKKIIEQHNGDISVSSVESEGTKFTILLPRQQLES